MFQPALAQHAAEDIGNHLDSDQVCTVNGKDVSVPALDAILIEL